MGEFIEDLLDKRDELERVFQSPGVSMEARMAAAEQIREIELALADPGEVAGPTGDPLVDRWEEQLARGEVPDLNETR